MKRLLLFALVLLTVTVLSVAIYVRPWSTLALSPEELRLTKSPYYLELCQTTVRPTRTRPKRALAQCPGLHASIRAAIVPLKRGYSEPAHVQLIFVLLNDSESILDVAARSWKIVIDGVDLAESGIIFGNGPMPLHGWQPLQPGEYYEFGKGLPIDDCFGHAGEYRVSWRGEGFQSATVSVKISNRH